MALPFFCTAKRLRNLAQGCRVALLPWDRIVEEGPTPKRLRPLPIENRHNPVGVSPCLDPFTQGSRAARQPWAKLRNRFAVQITFNFVTAARLMSSNGLSSVLLSWFRFATLFLLSVRRLRRSLHQPPSLPSPRHSAVLFATVVRIEKQRPLS